MHVPTKGRPTKLSIEDQILLCLSYWREYRTLFHVATSYGVSEPTASRIVRHVEDCLYLMYRSICLKVKASTGMW
ncbi:helix-turn-helix domain-containing protein [Acinetobacter sp. ANC 4558]|uniref:helix-turn-helix domain-containing protein n=1 Tax=Acinetobacter sp. ANC 4558 TaxID=1977876 RepID=UPI001D1770D2